MKNTINKPLLQTSLQRWAQGREGHKPLSKSIAASPFFCPADSFRFDSIQIRIVARVVEDYATPISVPDPSTVITRVEDSPPNSPGFNGFPPPSALPPKYNAYASSSSFKPRYDAGPVQPSLLARRSTGDATRSQGQQQYQSPGTLAAESPEAEKAGDEDITMDEDDEPIALAKGKNPQEEEDEDEMDWNSEMTEPESEDEEAYRAYQVAREKTLARRAAGAEKGKDGNGSDAGGLTSRIPFPCAEEQSDRITSIAEGDRNGRKRKSSGSPPSNPLDTKRSRPTPTSGSRSPSPALPASLEEVQQRQAEDRRLAAAAIRSALSVKQGGVSGKGEGEEASGSASGNAGSRPNGTQRGRGRGRTTARGTARGRSVW